jgi:uncharacterized delta-60 repeat protein
MRIQLFRRALLGALLASVWAALLAAPAAAAPLAQLAPGALDSTFTGFTDDGIVNPAGLSSARSIALQPDGKIVVVGETATTNELAVFRYLPNGQPDTTFDGDGKAIFPDMFLAGDVAIQSDAKIVVAGFRNNTKGFQLARLTREGALDPSFGQGGWLNDNDIRLDDLSTVLVQRDGKIVACGSANSDAEGEGDFAVTRYNTNGVRDTAFGIVFIAYANHPPPRTPSEKRAIDERLAVSYTQEARYRYVISL